MLSVIPEDHTDVPIADKKELEEQVPQNIFEELFLVCQSEAEELATSVNASEVEPEEETSPQRCCLVS